MKHRNVEILVERDSSFLPFAHDFFVAPLKIVRAQIEPLHRSFPLFTIPPVRAEHSANVEEDVPDVRHAINTARAGAPSQPSIRSGRQMS